MLIIVDDQTGQTVGYLVDGVACLFPASVPAEDLTAAHGAADPGTWAEEDDALAGRVQFGRPAGGDDTDLWDHEMCLYLEDLDDDDPVFLALWGGDDGDE